jgi:DNA-binding transcriptional MerR regulator
VEHQIQKGAPLPQPLSPDSWYHARAFAELAGVTVRTLHHYDHVGLLKPRKRSNRGYRLYQLKDLQRVEQIVALKCLGLSLSDIRRVLDREPASLQEELARQHRALLEKRRLLDHALAVIQDAQLAIERGEPTIMLLQRIIRVLDMQNDSNWMMKYYSPAAQAKIAVRAASFTTEMQAQISEAWKQYYRDLRALAEQEDPDGRKEAELAERHRHLVAAFTGNDPEIEAGLTALYRDRGNWPAEMENRIAEYEEIPNPPAKRLSDSALRHDAPE